MEIWNETGTTHAASILTGGKFTSSIFMCFLGFFRKMGGVTAQHGNGAA